MVHWARCAVWRRPCLNRNGSDGAEGARRPSHKVEDMAMYVSIGSRMPGASSSASDSGVIVSVLWALLLVGVTLTIGVLTDSLDTYIEI